MNWSDLEREFSALTQPLRDARLDGQSGAAGDHWRVAAAFDQLAASRFEVLAEAAGRLLTLEGIPLHEVPAQESDPAFRWYKFLQHHTQFFEFRSPAQQINDDGSSAGWLYSGWINSPARVSALACLQLATRAVVQPPAGGAIPTPDSA